MAGMAPRADDPRPSGSTGTTRQPSTVRPSSAASASTVVLALAASSASNGQEGQADGVLPRAGQREAGLDGGLSQEAVRDLHQNPRPVTRRHLGPRCPSMGQPLQHGQPTVDDGVIGTTVQVGHHADTTGVVLVGGVVETGCHVVLPK